ncbi:MAG: methionine adenosyltransferase [Phycisphaerales bacterium]|nr:methionine adenosyltransferase [Phycisphaerales bacterium]
MRQGAQLFTSESVSMGHPDKVADQISDAVLDAFLTADSHARVACETLVTTGLAVVAGEVGYRPSAKHIVDVPKIARETILRIGYDDPAMKFDGNGCGVLATLHAQSADIARGVTGKKKRQGAGDQGMMFGFACSETKSLMPLPISLAHQLVARQALVRREGKIPHLRPDAKSQVTVEYTGTTPRSVTAVVLSTQHGPDWNETQAALRAEVIRHIIRPVLGDWWHDSITVHCNPTGRFEIGGPHGDCGLTGRKIIVDTYGGRGRHGGGAFSGKDPSKVDRSAAYMCRYIAKNIVAAGLAEVCELQVAYAIGVADPISVFVDTQGTGAVDEIKLAKLVRDHFDLTPAGIIDTLQLRKPIYSHTAYHGHFGREPGESGKGTFTWEKTDLAAALRRAAGKFTARSSSGLVSK